MLFSTLLSAHGFVAMLRSESVWGGGLATEQAAWPMGVFWWILITWILLSREKEHGDACRELMVMESTVDRLEKEVEELKDALSASSQNQDEEK